MFTDPAGQFSFDVPLRYVYQPLESTLSTVTFRDWSDPSELLGVAARSSLAAPDAPWDVWVEGAAVATGLDHHLLTPTRRGKITGVLANVENQAEGRRGQMFIARGIRIDVQAQLWHAAGAAHPGPPDALERIWETLDVPANSFLPAMQSEKEVKRLLARAQRNAGRGRPEPARRQLQEIRRLAQSIYLYGLMVRGHLPEIAAIQYVVIALSNLAQIDGSMLPLRDAEQLAWRAYAELGSLSVAAPEAARLRSGLENMLRLIAGLHPRLPGEEDQEGMPAPGWGSARLRIVPFAYDMERMQPGPGTDGPSMTEICEASVRDQLTWQLGQEAAIASNQAGSLSAAAIARMARAQSRYMISPNLVSTLLTLTGLRSREGDLIGSADASALAVEVARDPAGDEDWRRSAAEGGLPDALATLARALCSHASSLWAVQDDQSLDDARTALAEAAALADELADEGELRAQICRQQAGVYLETGRADEALQAVERGLRACQNVPHPLSAGVSLRLFKSQLLLTADDFAGAEAALRDIRYPSGGDQVAAQHLRADELFAAARVQQGLGHKDQALASLASSLDAIFKLSPFEEQAVRMLMFGSQLEFDRNFKLAVRMNLAAIAALEARRAAMVSNEYRTNFAEAPLRREVYGNIAGLLMLFDGAQAMAVADMGRARVLADVLGIRTRADDAGALLEPPPELAGENPEESLGRAADYVSGSAAKVLGGRGNPQIMTADSVRRLAGQVGSPILMIQPFAGTLAMFLLSPSGDVRTALSAAEEDDLRADVETVNQALRIFTVPRGAADTDGVVAAEPAGPLSGPLHRLWQALIEPVAEGLPEGGPLIIVPYRDLTLVPYALLEDSLGNPLIERFALAVAPSLAILNHQIRRGPYRRSPQRAYLAGDPAVDAGQFLPPLSGALREVHVISERLKQSGVSEDRIALRHGTSASLESYRSEARHCDLVHLACHGRLEEPAANSRLYLAPGQSDDGLLLAGEASDVPLDDALVFLSACQTGQGRATADGVIGFGQAFLQAGARVVIASLWKVADAATSRLAEHFYGALLHGTGNAATALQAAMLALREDLAAGRVIDQDGTRLTPDPVNWAAFLAFGDALSVSYAEAT